MKVALIQLSDWHIENEHDFIINKQNKIISAIKPVLNNCQKVIIIIPGDLANTGRKEEYVIADRFLEKFEENITTECGINDIELVIVPGNHDCFLPEKPNSIREAIMQKEQDKDILDNEEFIDLFLTVQNNYWDFYTSKFDETPRKFISRKKIVKITDQFNIEFHLYNTSLFSSRNEIVGSLKIPENYFLTRNCLDRNNYVISVFHHNTGWLSPNTPNNNKKSFEEHLLENSDIVMCGHEHNEVNRTISNLHDNDSIIYFEAGAFQYKHTSKFEVIELDTDELNLTCHRFEYKMLEDHTLDHYSETIETPIVLNKKSKILRIKKSFEEELMRFNLPIKIKGKTDLKLSDLYVYPDLDPILDSIDSFGQYIDSSDLTTNWVDDKTIVIEGESQSGKTSLIYMIFLMSYRRGKYPLLLKGIDLISAHTTSLIEKLYKQQYESQIPYDIFKQIDKTDKILLIDNIDNSEANNACRKQIVTDLEKSFGTVIITTKDSLNFHNINYSGKTGDVLKHYNILSFGSVKRNELIEKWVQLESNAQTTEINVKEEQVKLLFDQVSNLLGEQFITPYPIFLLSLLQSLSSITEPINIEQTYYAYCYSSLILNSIQSTGVDSDTQKEFLNILTEFAYYMYKHELKRIKITEIQNFYEHYKKDNIFKNPLDITLEKLCDANIIRKIESNVFCFSYKYIFYYLVAQKISQFIFDEKGKDIVNELCSEIYNETSANILIFLVYHTKNQDLIESLLLTSMDTFSEYLPITMANDDGFMKNVSDLLANVKNNVLIADIDPHQERERNLKMQDERARKRPVKNLDEDLKELEELKKDKDLRDIVQTIRSIKILGQIIKNQKFSIGKNNISSILEEAYLSCFRMISFYSHYLKKEENNIVQMIKDNHDNDLTSEEIQKKVQKFLSSLLYRICLGAFSTLSLAVGTQNLEEEYDKVAQKLASPAAKLVSFTIKSFYGPLKITELEDLVTEFSGNHLATHILKARALHYVYNNTIDYKQKQRIGEICNMQLINNAVIEHNQKR